MISRSPQPIFIKRMAKIEKTASGKYRVRVCIGKDTDGKYRYRSFTHVDRKRLQHIAAEYLDRNRQTVDTDAIDRAVEDYIAIRRPVLSPESIRSYNAILRRLRADYGWLCDIPVNGLDKLTYQKFVNELVKSGLSPKTIRGYVGLISATITNRGYAPPKVTLPKEAKPDTYFPNEEETRRILQLAKGTDLEIPIQLGMMGLRRGEICGLTVDDIDGTTVHIRRAMAQDEYGRPIVKGTKTVDSDRYIQIPQSLADKIKAQGYVTTLTPHHLTNRFVRFKEKYGIKNFRFHDLRAFFASYCHNVLKLSNSQIQLLGGWRTDYVLKKCYLKSMRNDEAMRIAADGIADIMS